MRFQLGRSLASAAGLLGCLCAVPAAAQPAPPQPCGGEELAPAPRVSIAGGRISMLPPPGMEAFPGGPVPRYELALANAMDAAFVFAWHSRWGADPAAAEHLAQHIELQSPEITWLVRDTVEMGGARWLRFHYTRRLEGQHLIYEQHYATTFQGRGVHVVANVPAHNQEAVAQLQRSASSLQVRDCALPAGTSLAVLQPGMCRPGQVGTFPDPEEPRRVETAGGRISIVPPEGFRPRSIPPRPNGRSRTLLAFANDAGAMITVVQGGPLPPVDSAADAMAAGMARSIDEVIGRGVAEVGGTRWGWLEFTGRMGPDRVHNLQYMAPFQGQGVVYFTSAPGDPELRAQMARSAASLKMADCALTPGRG